MELRYFLAILLFLIAGYLVILNVFRSLVLTLNSLKEGPSYIYDKRQPFKFGLRGTIAGFLITIGILLFIPNLWKTVIIWGILGSIVFGGLVWLNIWIRVYFGNRRHLENK